MILRVARRAVYPLLNGLLRSSVFFDCFAFLQFTLNSSGLIPCVAFQPDLPGGIRATPVNKAVRQQGSPSTMQSGLRSGTFSTIPVQFRQNMDS